jgi:hypothetical protein
MTSRFHIPDRARLSLAADVVSTAIPGETVILDPRGDRYFSLDGVGPRVWELLQASTTVADVVYQISDEYDVEPDVCERDVRALLGDLVDRGLVLVSDGTP